MDTETVAARMHVPPVNWGVTVTPTVDIWLSGTKCGLSEYSDSNANYAKRESINVKEILLQNL